MSENGRFFGVFKLFFLGLEKLFSQRIVHQNALYQITKK